MIFIPDAVGRQRGKFNHENTKDENPKKNEYWP